MADAITEVYHREFGGETNLSLKERGISLVLGLGLAAAGAQPRPNPLLNVLALAVGAYLALRGASGYCPIKAALDSRGADHGRIDRHRSAHLAGQQLRDPSSRPANKHVSAPGV